MNLHQKNPLSGPDPIIVYGKLPDIQDRSTHREPKKPHDELLTLKEAADLLHCHPNTLRNWDNEGILIAVRLGSRGDRRYRKKDVMKLMDEGHS